MGESNVEQGSAGSFLGATNCGAIISKILCLLMVLKVPYSFCAHMSLRGRLMMGCAPLDIVFRLYTLFMLLLWRGSMSTPVEHLILGQ